MPETHAFGDREARFKDLTATTDLYKTLVDVRFKLLLFVPTITGLTVGILKFNLTNIDPIRPTLIVSVGMLGLIVTLAIVIYEIRNSQIHDRAIHRIKHLERVLGFEPSYRGSAGGVFNERGSGDRLFWVIGVKHDRSLELIYGSVVAAWTWMVVIGAAAAKDWSFPAFFADGRFKVAVAVAAGLAVAGAIGRHSGQGREPRLVYTLAKAANEATVTKSAKAAQEAARAMSQAAEAVEKTARAEAETAKTNASANVVQVAVAKATVAKNKVTKDEHAEYSTAFCASVLDKLEKAVEAIEKAAQATQTAKTVEAAQNAHNQARSAKVAADEAAAIMHLGALVKDGLESIRREVDDPTETRRTKSEEGRNKALVELAYATGLIKDEQKWWSFWWYGVRPDTVKNARDKRLKAVPGKCERLDADAVRFGVVGADEVAAAMSELGGTGLVIWSSRQRIEKRYGKGAPWGTDDEIKLRIDLLTAVGWPGQ